MDPKVLFDTAIECDQAGLLFQSLDCYNEGIDSLMEAVSIERNSQKRVAMHERIKDYIDRAEQIKASIRTRETNGNLTQTLNIAEDDVGYGYGKTFANFIMNENVRELAIEDPYFSSKLELADLLALLEIAVKKCTSLKYVRVCTRSDSENSNEQETHLAHIKEDMARKDITLSVSFDETLEVSKVASDQGRFVIVQPSLHYFKSMPARVNWGLSNHNLRKCKNSRILFYEP